MRNWLSISRWISLLVYAGYGSLAYTRTGLAGSAVVGCILFVPVFLVWCGHYLAESQGNGEVISRGGWKSGHSLMLAGWALLLCPAASWLFDRAL